MVSTTGIRSPNVGNYYSGLTEKKNYALEFPGVQGPPNDTLATIPTDFVRVQPQAWYGLNMKKAHDF